MARTSLIGLLALLGSTSVVACAVTPAPESFEGAPSAGTRGKKSKTSTSEDEITTAPASTSSTSVPAREVPEEPAPVVEAEDTVWLGTLAKTTAAKFGGTPYCQYEAHYENVTAKVVIGPDGKVKGANVTGTAVETPLNDCPNAAIPSNLHRFVLGEESGLTFSIDATEGEPLTKLAGTFSAAGPTGSITFKISRTDQVAPLVWTVNATVPLTQQQNVPR